MLSHDASVYDAGGNGEGRIAILPMAFDQFVGRDEELVALTDCLRRASEGRSVLVAVSGEAGVGKSRLVREFCARNAGHIEKTITGRCLETIKAPFLPFVHVFRELALEPGFDLDRLEEPAARGRVQKERHVARLQQMAHTLLKATAPKPRVIIIEDVHWADAATLELLEHLALAGEEGRLLVIVTLRADGMERGSTLARVLSRLRGGGLVFVRLAALDASQVSTLLRSAAPSLSRAVVERIKALSEGNPLFAEELLRAAIDGDATLSHPAYSSIRATVIDRLYKLTEADQQIVACASVVGRFFDVRFVQALADQDFDRVIAALRRARNLQLIREVPENAGEVLAFRHAIFASIIHDELLGVEARHLHLRLAEYLEREDDAKRRIAEIAHHYSVAHEAKKALLYNARAGDDAMSVTAFEDAARFYDEALRYAGAGTPIFAQLAEKRAYAWYAAGVAENTDALFSEAMTAYEALGRRQKVIEMLLFLSRQAWNDAQTVDGYRHAVRAIELIEEHDDELRDYARTMAASYAAHLGNLDEAESLIADVAACLKPEITARIIDTRAVVIARRGRLDDAWSICLEAQRIAQDSGDADAIVRVFSNSADIAAARGRRREAAALWRQAYAAARNAGYIGRMAYAALGYAAALLDCGLIDEAREPFATAMTAGVSNASVAIQAVCVGAMFRAYTGEPSMNSIREAFALDLAIRSRESLRIGQLGSALVFAHLAEGRHAEVRAVLRVTVDALETPAFAELLLAFGAIAGDRETRTRSLRLLQDAAADRATFAGVCRLAVTAPREALRLAEEQGCELLRRVLSAQLGKNGRISERRTPTLTRREIEVARLLADSLSNRGIAEHLGISERTVEHHVESILSRLGLRSRWLVTPDVLAQLT
jgi:predicted ATPase/DNA-binding CsgD family transcriptional regulator